jgi:RNA polymerase sigma factor (sigma-70 family)
MATGKLSGAIRQVRRTAFLQDGARMTDGQLLDRFLNQCDEAAFALLMRRHGPMVLGVCRRVLANSHDAEDAFQATFLVLARKAASIRRRELVGNWLYGAAYRAALEAKAARRRSRETQVNPMPDPEAPAADPWDDLRLALDHELSRLPDKYRVPVILCDLEGRTRREAARLLGVPEGTLSGRLTTAHRKLARRLTRRGITLSGAALAAVLSQKAACASVPASLGTSTIEAVTAVAAGQGALAPIVSTKVAALAEGVVKTMLLSKLKSITIVLAALAVLSGGGTLLTYRASGADTVAPKADPLGEAINADLLARASAITDEPKESGKKSGDDQNKPEVRDYGFLGVIFQVGGDAKQVLVYKVFPDSPAANAGIRAGDVFLKIADVGVMDPNSAVEVLKQSKPGDKTTIEFRRKDRARKADVTFGNWPANWQEFVDAAQKEAAQPEQEPAGEGKERGYVGLLLGNDDDGRVVVTGTAPNSPASKAFKAEDVILRVGKVEPKQAEDLIKELAGLKTGDKLTFHIRRGDKERDITITAAKRPADFGNK